MPRLLASTGSTLQPRDRPRVHVFPPDCGGFDASVGVGDGCPSRASVGCWHPSSCPRGQTGPPPAATCRVRTSPRRPVPPPPSSRTRPPASRASSTARTGENLVERLLVPGRVALFADGGGLSFLVLQHGVQLASCVGQRSLDRSWRPVQAQPRPRRRTCRRSNSRWGCASGRAAARPGRAARGHKAGADVGVTRSSRVVTHSLADRAVHVSTGRSVGRRDIGAGAEQDRTRTKAAT